MSYLSKNIVAIIDTREQRPLSLTKYVPELTEVREALPYGDYSLAVPSLKLEVCVERKSLDDLANSIVKAVATEDTFNNFKKTLLAMRGYRYKMVVVEGTLSQILSKTYRSKVHPNCVMGFISYWMGNQGIPFLFSDSHEGTSYIVAKFLYNIARSAYNEEWYSPS